MRAFICSDVSAFDFATNLLISIIFPRFVSKGASRTSACSAAASCGPSARDSSLTASVASMRAFLQDFPVAGDQSFNIISLDVNHGGGVSLLDLEVAGDSRELI